MVKLASPTLRLIGLIIALALAVACRDFDSPPPPDSNPQAPNITIAELNRLVGDKALQISEPLRIGGYVTTSDEESNFHKTLIIQDDTGAAELMAGIYDLHNIYPQGYYLSVRLDGCAVGRHYGVLQIGLPAKSYSNYPTDYFASRVLLDKHITCHNHTQPTEPRTLPTGKLDTSLCGTLIRIESLTLASHLYPEAWEVNPDGKWRGYNFFSAADGSCIVVYTSDYAIYTDHPIPSGEVALTGILQYGKINGSDHFMIKMRCENDCERYEL